MAIGVALIGSGIFAQAEHFPAIQKCADLDLRAVYSRRLASTEKLVVGLANVNVYADDAGAGKSYPDLLKRSDIHAVIIALPILVQPEFITQAIAAGKHVLSEKPIAKDVATAKKLANDVTSAAAGHIRAPTWCVGENYRMLVAINYAAAKVKAMGRVLGFRTKVSSMINPGYKYLETEWRKNPGFEGGFLLDGGVHFIAATRLLLGSAHEPKKVCAFTSKLQSHIPDVDTVHSIWQTESGITGTFTASFGTTDLGTEWVVNTEYGTVIVSGAPRKVTVIVDGKVLEQRTFTDERSGVPQEVAIWAKGLVSGQTDPKQTPAEAMIDLELLEAMLDSGKQGGVPVDISAWSPAHFPRLRGAA